jgi:glutathione S-transferase
MATRTWAMGDTFSMADCAAMPPLVYCRQFHPYDAYKHMVAYCNRLIERPSAKRVLEESQPFFWAAMNRIRGANQGGV